MQISFGDTQNFFRLVRDGNLSALAALYYQHALACHKSGSPFLEYLTESNYCLLLDFKSPNIPMQVTIRSANDQYVCPACQELTDKVFSLEYALQEMILPCKTCSSVVWPKRKPGFCRCGYHPIVKLP